MNDIHDAMELWNGIKKKFPCCTQYTQKDIDRTDMFFL
jgi:hypothetical protein